MRTAYRRARSCRSLLTDRRHPTQSSPPLLNPYASRVRFRWRPIEYQRYRLSIFRYCTTLGRRARSGGLVVSSALRKDMFPDSGTSATAISPRRRELTRVSALITPSDCQLCRSDTPVLWSRSNDAFWPMRRRKCPIRSSPIRTSSPFMEFLGVCSFLEPQIDLGSSSGRRRRCRSHACLLAMKTNCHCSS